VVNLVTIFKVPCNKYFLFGITGFCTRIKIPGAQCGYNFDFVLPLRVVNGEKKGEKRKKEFLFVV
jgi:hypothetical protein